MLFEQRERRSPEFQDCQLQASHQENLRQKRKLYIPLWGGPSMSTQKIKYRLTVLYIEDGLKKSTTSVVRTQALPRLGEHIYDEKNDRGYDVTFIQRAIPALEREASTTESNIEVWARESNDQQDVFGNS